MTCANEKVDLRFTKFKVIRGRNSRNTPRLTFIFPHANLHISTSKCTKFGENPLNGVGRDALTRRWTQDLQSLNSSRAITLEIQKGQHLSPFTRKKLHIGTSMYTMFGENPSSGVGEDALTRRWTDVRTDVHTDGQTEKMTAIYDRLRWRIKSINTNINSNINIYRLNENENAGIELMPKQKG